MAASLTACVPTRDGACPYPDEETLRHILPVTLDPGSGTAIRVEGRYITAHHVVAGEDTVIVNGYTVDRSVWPEFEALADDWAEMLPKPTQSGLTWLRTPVETEKVYVAGYPGTYGLVVTEGRVQGMWDGLRLMVANAMAGNSGGAALVCRGDEYRVLGLVTTIGAQPATIPIGVGGQMVFAASTNYIVFAIPAERIYSRVAGLED